LSIYPQFTHCLKSNGKTTTTDETLGNETAANSRVRYRKRKFTKEGLLQDEDATSIPTRPDETKSTTKHAMTVLRAFDVHEKYDYSVITIEDEGLRTLFLHALSHHPGFSHWGNVTLYSLFEPVMHNWSLLNDFADNNTKHPAVSSLHVSLKSGDPHGVLAPLKGKLEKAASDLKQLLEQVRETPGLEKYFDGVREMSEKANTIPFDHLWTIFPPGELVYSRTYEDQAQVFIVKESTDYIYRRIRSNDRTWVLTCWTYDWNGTVFNRVPIQFTFEDFKGTRSISSLHCYPLSSHLESPGDNSSRGDDRGHDMKAALINRGTRYRELCLKNRGKQIFEYDGFALSRGTGVRKVIKTNQVSPQGSSNDLVK